MARERRGRSLVEGVDGALRSDVLFGRRLPTDPKDVEAVVELPGHRD